MVLRRALHALDLVLVNNFRCHRPTFPPRRESIFRSQGDVHGPEMITYYYKARESLITTFSKRLLLVMEELYNQAPPVISPERQSSCNSL